MSALPDRYDLVLDTSAAILLATTAVSFDALLDLGIVEVFDAAAAPGSF